MSPRLQHHLFLFRQYARNRGALVGTIILALFVLAALFADVLYPVNPLRIVGRPELWPFENWRFPLGTDSMGRDIAAMIVHGARTTLLIGLAASLAATVIGLTVGAVAAWFGGWVDEIMMRITELFQIIPNVVFILTVVSILGPSFVNIIIAVGLISWPPVARLTRAEFLTYKNREFVQACVSMGMKDFRILFAEIMPNAIPPVVVLSSLIVAGAILYESVVSFLGLGDPNIASWGRLVGEGRTLIRTSWYLCAVPGLAIMLMVLSLNLIGDGLNDVLNPKMRDR